MRVEMRLKKLEDKVGIDAQSKNMNVLFVNDDDTITRPSDMSEEIFESICNGSCSNSILIQFIAPKKAI